MNDMILTIYLGLIILSLAFILIGFKIDNPVLEIGGFFFLFVLGLVMMGGNVQYKVGAFNDQTHIYGNALFYENGTPRYHWEYVEQSLAPSQKEDIRLFHIREYSNIVYANFDAETSGELLGKLALHHLLGMLVGVFGGFGMAISTFNMRMTGEV